MAAEGGPGDAFWGFMRNLESDAAIRKGESTDGRAKRYLDEIIQTMEDGVESQEEATYLLGKLDLVLETSKDIVVKAGAADRRKALPAMFPDLQDDPSLDENRSDS